MDPLNVIDRIASLPLAQRERLEEYLRKLEAEPKERFIERIHALPPELFSAIYDFTFNTFPSEEEIVITTHHKWPAVAQVDKSSRKQYLDSYLANSTFVVRNENVGGRWLRRAMHKDYHKSIGGIRFDDGLEFDSQAHGWQWQTPCGFRISKRNAIHRVLASFGVSLEARQMYVRVDGHWVND